MSMKAVNCSVLHTTASAYHLAFKDSPIIHYHSILSHKYENISNLSRKRGSSQEIPNLNFVVTLKYELVRYSIKKVFFVGTVNALFFISGSFCLFLGILGFFRADYNIGTFSDNFFGVSADDVIRASIVNITERSCRLCNGNTHRRGH